MADFHQRLAGMAIGRNREFGTHLPDAGTPY
jgi:hypothetical protein